MQQPVPCTENNPVFPTENKPVRPTENNPVAFTESRPATPTETKPVETVSEGKRGRPVSWTPENVSDADRNFAAEKAITART